MSGGEKSKTKVKSSSSATKVKSRKKEPTVPVSKSFKKKESGGLFFIFKSFVDKLFGGFLGSNSTSNTVSARRKRRGKSSKDMTQEHLEKSFRAGDANARIQKELRAFMSNPPDGCRLAVGANLRVWIVTITGADNTIYAGEKYKLKFIFPKDYPTKPPSVYFLKPCPKHVHVYSNGDICLNLLGRDWRPNMTAQQLAISILSMMSSAKEKKIPPDNAMHADSAPGQAQDHFMYHDDSC